jgi:hypothetical protein
MQQVFGAAAPDCLPSSEKLKIDDPGKAIPVGQQKRGKSDLERFPDQPRGDVLARIPGPEQDRRARGFELVGSALTIGLIRFDAPPFV